MGSSRLSDEPSSLPVPRAVLDHVRDREVGRDVEPARVDEDEVRAVGDRAERNNQSQIRDLEREDQGGTAPAAAEAKKRRAGDPTATSASRPLCRLE